MTWMTSGNVSTEAWRHILEDANHELAVEALIIKHGTPISFGFQLEYKAIYNY